MQAGHKKQEVITDLLPGRGKNHQRHRMVAIQVGIPVKTEAVKKISNNAQGRVEHENPERPGNGWRHRVRPYQ